MESRMTTEDSRHQTNKDLNDRIDFTSNENALLEGNQGPIVKVEDSNNENTFGNRAHV